MLPSRSSKGHNLITAKKLATSKKKIPISMVVEIGTEC